MPHVLFQYAENRIRKTLSTFYSTSQSSTQPPPPAARVVPDGRRRRGPIRHSAARIADAAVPSRRSPRPRPHPGSRRRATRSSAVAHPVVQWRPHSRDHGPIPLRRRPTVAPSYSTSPANSSWRTAPLRRLPYLVSSLDLPQQIL
jgi:hypothetical protein